MADRDGGSRGHCGIPQTQGSASFAIQAGGGSAVYHGNVPDQAAAAAGNAAGPPPVSPHWEFVYRAAERFGIPVVILGFVLWWARNDLIQPLLDAHFQFLDKISDAHEKQSDRLSDIGEKLDTLIRVQEGR